MHTTLAFTKNQSLNVQLQDKIEKIFGDFGEALQSPLRPCPPARLSASLTKGKTCSVPVYSKAGQEVSLLAGS